MTDPNVDQFGAPPTVTQPMIEVVRGRYRHAHPVTGEPMMNTRVTTFAKTIEDTYGLGVWAKRMVLAGAAARPDIVAEAALLDVADDKKRVDELAEAAMEAAGAGQGARRGTAGHKLTDIVDRGEAIPEGVSDEARADVESYRAELDRLGLEVVPEYMERTGCELNLGVTGTFDRLYRVKSTGELIVGDYKTTKNISYAWLGYCVQVCVYAHFEWLADKAAGEWVRPPEVSRERAVILNNPVGSGVTKGYMVDLQGARSLVRLCREVRDARKAASGLVTLVP